MNLNDISACVRSIAQGLTYDDSLREAIAKHKLYVLLSQLPDGVPAAAPSAEGNPAGTPGAKVDVSRLSSDLPPPHDSQEEAQRAAGIWPQKAEPATVLVEPKTRGDDAHHEGLMLRPPGWPVYAAPKPSALDEMAAQAASWVGNRAVGASPALGAPYGEKCNYPKCTCPFDAPADPNWCARGLPKQKAEDVAHRAEYLQKLGYYLDKLIELEGKAS